MAFDSPVDADIEARMPGTLSSMDKLIDRQLAAKFPETFGNEENKSLTERLGTEVDALGTIPSFQSIMSEEHQVINAHVI